MWARSRQSPDFPCGFHFLLELWEEGADFPQGPVSLAPRVQRVRLPVSADASLETSGKLCQHSCPPVRPSGPRSEADVVIGLGRPSRFLSSPSGQLVLLLHDYTHLFIPS